MIRLPCGSRRRHQHTIEWKDETGRRGAAFDHGNALLWLTLAKLEILRHLGDVADLYLDGEPWEPNPRDGWNALQYLQYRVRNGDPVAAKMLTPLHERMVRWTP